MRTPATVARRPIPGWVLALGLYLAARLVTWGITLSAAAGQPQNSWTPADPSYGEFVSMWDGARYQRIAESGYPHPFPLDPRTGEPTQSEWAFFPGYPALVRLVMAVTGSPFTTAAPWVSLLLGGLAVVAAQALFQDVVGRDRALAGVALLVTFPTAAVLQYSYSEAMALAALMGTLLALQRRRYGWALVPAVLLCLTRPIGLALVPAIAVVVAGRWIRRHEDPFPARQRWALLGLGTGCVLAALAFPAVVALVSGRGDGYTRVQVAWRVSDHMEYFIPWLWMGRYLFGPVLGVVAVAVLVAAVAAVLAAPQVRDLGLVIWAWAFGYLVYLAAVVDPFTSVFRFLLMLTPLAPALVGRRVRPGWVVVLVMASTLLQVWWIRTLWVFHPPSDFPP